MTTKYIPEGLTLMELACINWVLSAIKTDILNGTPSGKAIDQALDEIQCLAGTPSDYFSGVSSADKSSDFESSAF